MGDQVANLISCLDSALSVMNFLDHTYVPTLYYIQNL